MWATFTKKDGLADNKVRSIAVDRGRRGLVRNGRERSKSGTSPRRRAWTNFTSKNGLEIDYVKEATAVDGLGGALARKLRSESLRSQRQGRGAGSPRGMASPTMLCKPWRWTKWARSGSKTYVRSQPLGSQDRFVGHARREGRLHENHRCGREWRSLVWSGRRRSKTSRPLLSDRSRHDFRNYCLADTLARRDEPRSHHYCSRSRALLS